MSNRVRPNKIHPGRKHAPALKHGAFAQTAILPGEDPREFEELHSAIIEVGPTEEDAVLSIAKGVWRKRRAQKFLEAEIEICRFDPKHPLYDEAQKLRRLLTIMETAPFFNFVETAPDFFERGLQGLINLFVSGFSADYLRDKCPRQNFESASAWFQALHNEVASVLLPVLGLSGEAPPDVLLGRSAKFLTPDVFKHELAVDERIDATIDRAIKRLIQTKAMKQMLVGTSPNGGNHQPKKSKAASSRNQEKVSTTNAAREADGGGHRGAPKAVRRRSAAGGDLP
jgi:hypothetical protein